MTIGQEKNTVSQAARDAALIKRRELAALKINCGGRGVRGPMFCAKFTLWLGDPEVRQHRPQ